MPKRRQPSNEERLAELRAKSLAYMADPDTWVQLVCPLKRYDRTGAGFTQGGDATHGFLTGDGPRVRIGNMFMMSGREPVLEYADFGAVVDDGWTVD